MHGADSPFANNNHGAASNNNNLVQKSSSYGFDSFADQFILNSK